MYIYKITDTANNKIYIGLCTRPIEKSSHYLGSGKIISAIAKARKHTLTKTILEEGFDSLEALRLAEKKYINLYDSRNPEIGYNLSKGGDFTKPKPYERTALSEEHKQNISEAVKGSSWYINPETKESRMFHYDPGYPWIKGRPSSHIYKGPKSPESIEKMRASLIGKKYSDEANKKKGRPGTRWYHNPETGEAVMDYNQPEGYVPGRPKKL